MKNFRQAVSFATFNWKRVAPVLFLGICFAAHTAQAQNLTFEGPTGIFITQTAATADSSAKTMSKPVIGIHYMPLGKVYGSFSTFSITEGFAKRYEVGFTSEMHSNGSNQLPSASQHAGAWGTGTHDTWDDYRSGTPTQAGFYNVNAKVNVLAENSFGTKWFPAISVGGIYRFSDNFGGDGSTDVYVKTGSLPHSVHTWVQNTHNGDLYLVGTKNITDICSKFPLQFSAGLRGTDAAEWGLLGNAPGFKALGFGSLSIGYTFPKKATVLLATEVAQQPLQLKVGQGAFPSDIIDLPTSVSYIARIIPASKYKLNIDAGVLHASTYHSAMNANDRFIFGVSYGF